MVSSCGQRRLWSDWADAQADLSLRWAHSHIVGFVMSRLMCEPTRITELCQCASVRSKTMWTGKAFQRTTVNFLNVRTPPKNCCNHPKSLTRWRFLRVMFPKDAEGIADPDQTAPVGVV